MNLLHQLVDAAARTHPDRLAVADRRTRWTYRELATMSRRYAGWLASTGVGRGDRVILALPTGIELPALVYACSRIGAVSVPLRPDTPPVVAAHAWADARPALVVTDAPGWVEVAGAAARPLPTVDTLPADAPPVEVLAVDPACFIYTSGSTAMPKAVVCTHQQMTFVAGAIAARLRYRPEDVVFCALPLSFDYGLYQVFLCALAGARLHLATAEDAGHRLLVGLDRSRATVLPAVPSLAANLARLLARGGTLPSLRLITNTGAAMPESTVDQLRKALPGLTVQLMYGLTECKRATIMEPDGDLVRPGACGRALPGTEVFVVDEQGRRRPAGDVGEVVVRGPHVMAGYWRQPELTAARFPRVDGLYPQLRTGDYGFMDDEGYLYFTGRRDDMYKERGFRVSVIEVEAAAMRVAGVRAAVVVPPTPPAAGATLLVESDRTAADVLAALRDQLDEVKLPARCVVVASLPLTANGKVDRSALVGVGDHG